MQTPHLCASAEFILASSSRYRKDILEKIGLPFNSLSPNIDETPRPNETATNLVKRLSLEKANAFRDTFPNTYIIGSDQVLSIEDQILGKPINHQQAVEQLMYCSGKYATLFTGLALVNKNKNMAYVDIDSYSIQYRKFTLRSVENYLRLEKPYDCCGSLKIEAAGIVLIKKLTGSDPNTLLGFPLLKLIDYLQDHKIIDFFNAN